MSSEQVVNAPFQYINGMVGSWVSNSTLSISAGACRDSTNTFDISTSVATVVSTAFVGLNGLDTGTVAASTVYTIYAIYDATEYKPTGFLLSTSMTGPALPFGYGAYKVVGYWATDSSSHLLLGYVSGNYTNRIFTYDAPQATAITAGNATTFTNVSLVATVPNVGNIPVNLMARIIPGVVDDTLFLQPSSGTGAVQVYGNVITAANTAFVKVLAQASTTSPSINYKVTASSDAANIQVVGFDYWV